MSHVGSKLLSYKIGIYLFCLGHHIVENIRKGIWILFFCSFECEIMKLFKFRFGLCAFGGLNYQAHSIKLPFSSKSNLLKS